MAQLPQNQPQFQIQQPQQPQQQQQQQQQQIPPIPPFIEEEEVKNNNNNNAEQEPPAPFRQRINTARELHRIYQTERSIVRLFKAAGIVRSRRPCTRLS